MSLMFLMFTKKLKMFHFKLNFLRLSLGKLPCWFGLCRNCALDASPVRLMERIQHFQKCICRVLQHVTYDLVTPGCCDLIKKLLLFCVRFRMSSKTERIIPPRYPQLSLRLVCVQFPIISI